MPAKELSLPISTQYDAIVAWRVWRISAENLLQSVFMADIWPAGQAIKACCADSELRHGIHAFAATEQCEARALAAAYMTEQSRGPKYVAFVLGEVSLWGRVVVHQAGYRAAYAYPRSLLVPSNAYDLASSLRRAYGVEVEMR